MAKNDSFHRILTYLRHVLTAWNTTGEGIHSPYLFRLVRFVIRDENSFYCFADIERRREALLQCEDLLDVLDFGTGGSQEGTHEQRRVCDIAKHHLERPKVGQLLFRIVNFLKQEQQEPLQILELGTSLGITTAYLAAPDSRNSVMTFEGSREVLKVAQGVWRALRLENIEWVEGNIDDTLYNRAREHLNLAYVDANHSYEATMRYVQFLLPRMKEKGIIAVDDIHLSPSMEQAWHELQSDPRVTTSIDLYHLGLLFVDTHYWKRNYRIWL